MDVHRIEDGLDSVSAEHRLHARLVFARRERAQRAAPESQRDRG